MKHAWQIGNSYVKTKHVQFSLRIPLSKFHACLSRFLIHLFMLIMHAIIFAMAVGQFDQIKLFALLNKH